MPGKSTVGTMLEIQEPDARKVSVGTMLQIQETHTEKMSC